MQAVRHEARIGLAPTLEPLSLITGIGFTRPQDRIEWLNCHTLVAWREAG